MRLRVGLGHLIYNPLSEPSGRLGNPIKRGPFFKTGRSTVVGFSTFDGTAFGVKGRASSSFDDFQISNIAIRVSNFDKSQSM